MNWQLRAREALIAEINKELAHDDKADAGKIADRILSLPNVRCAFGGYEMEEDNGRK